MSDVVADRVERMAIAARDPVVVLHKFNKLRSRRPDDVVLVFEGDDDPIFYSVIAARCGFKEFLALVAGGKDLVLGFRELLRESVEAQRGGGVAFLIDRDFDDLKGFSPGPELYCTPTYSIENIVCSSSALKQILYNEFKLHDPDLMGDLDSILTKYHEVVCDFAGKIRDINLLIYFGRKKSFECSGAVIREIEDPTSRMFVLNPATLECVCYCEGEASLQFVRFSKKVELCDADVVESDFSLLDPTTRWRGKFWLALLQRFVAVLVEDRNSTAPRFFSRGRGRIRLNMNSDSVFRLLASTCEIPSCMSEFFCRIPVNSLR